MEVYVNPLLSSHRECYNNCGKYVSVIDWELFLLMDLSPENHSQELYAFFFYCKLNLLY